MQYRWPNGRPSPARHGPTRRGPKPVRAVPGGTTCRSSSPSTAQRPFGRAVPARWHEPLGPAHWPFDWEEAERGPEEAERGPEVAEVKESWAAATEGSIRSDERRTIGFGSGMGCYMC